MREKPTRAIVADRLQMRRLILERIIYRTRVRIIVSWINHLEHAGKQEVRREVHTLIISRTKTAGTTSSDRACWTRSSWSGTVGRRETRRQCSADRTYARIKWEIARMRIINSIRKGMWWWAAWWVMSAITALMMIMSRHCIIDRILLLILII